MAIFALGINHNTASVALREQVYFSADKLSCYLQDLAACKIVHETVLLSTCNRSELYCETDDIAPVIEWFCQQSHAHRAEVEQALYLHADEAAIEHIMRVACGIDSMIVGEPQIFGQLKTAFSESCAVGAVSNLFHRLFQFVFSVAKEIRTTTAIGACPVSVASAAVHFAKEHHADFRNANIAIIGTGETTQLLLKYLHNLSSTITVVGRNLEKASILQTEFNVDFVTMAYLNETLTSADIVFSATGSPVPLITKSALKLSRTAISSNNPLLLIDIAVPRDIEAKVNELENVQLYCIDDLKDKIKLNLHSREHAALKARELISAKSKLAIAEIYSHHKATPTIRAYRSQIEQICAIELHKAKQQLVSGMNAEQVLEEFSRAFVNKLMHSPSVQLRKASLEGQYDLLRLARQLFSLPETELEVELL